MPLADLSPDTSRLVLLDAYPAVSPDALFSHWTEPARLRAWWPEAAAVEPRVGGAYVFSWPGAGWRLRGRYAAFEPGR